MRERARAGSSVHARGSGIRGGSRSRGRASTQTSADDIHGARGSEAGNSDGVLWSVQGEGGVLSGRNPAGQCKAKVTMAFNAHGVLKNEGGSAAMQEEGLMVGDEQSPCSLHSRSGGTPPNHGQNQHRCGEDAGQ